MKHCLSLLPVVLISSLPASGLAMEDLGKAVYERHCSHCHAPGPDHPGTLQLSVTRGEAFSVLEQRSDLTPDYIKAIVRHGLRTMPGFKPTTLTHQQLDALAGYLGK